MMMTFVNMHSPGLKILATHRLVGGIEDWDPRRFLERAASRYRITRADTPEVLRAAWGSSGDGRAALGVSIADHLFLLESLEPDKRLDVEALHADLLEGALGIGSEALREERNVRYIRGLDAAVGEVLKGAAQVAFLLRPVSVEQVAQVAFSGGVMPQKSTDFYPKLLSGMTIYRLEP